MMLKEHDRVVLMTPVSEEGLEVGDVGTVVHVYPDGHAYEVEFVALDGHTTAVATLEASRIRAGQPAGHDPCARNPSSVADIGHHDPRDDDCSTVILGRTSKFGVVCENYEIL